MRQKKLDPNQLSELYKTKLLKGPGELHNSVLKICQAKRIDPNMILEARLGALQQEVSKMQQFGPAAEAKAKAKLDVYSKKRLAAI